MPQRGGYWGEWSDARPRKRKTQEQVIGQRDRLRDDQRHRGTRVRQQGQSRVGDKFDYTDSYETEEDCDYGYQEISDDGRVSIYYPRPEKARASDGLRYEDKHILERRRSNSSLHGNDVRDQPAPKIEQFKLQTRRADSHNLERRRS